MSQQSHSQSSVGDFSGSQHAQADVADTASSAVAPQAPGILPGMSGYVGTSTQATAPNTAFDARRARLMSRSGTRPRRTRSVSPMGLTLAQRQAQLAANMASSAASDVGRVAAAADATRNVAQQAMETASHAIETAGQSEGRAQKLFETMRDELRAKFDEDCVADETRRGWTETQIAVLGSSIERLQKRMEEMNVPNVNVLANLEQNLQKKITESFVDAHVGLDQLSKRLDEQVKSNEVTTSVLDNLVQKIDQLSENMATVQAEMQRWKHAEEEYNAENIEEDVTDMGNATASVPMSATPLTSTPYFIFGETAEIQPPQPTASQTMPIPVTLPSSFVDPAIRANTDDADFNPFTIPRSGEAQEFTNTGIPIVPDELFLNSGIQSEEAPRIDEAVNVPSGNVTPTRQAPLPPGAQKAISEICDQYLRQLGINPAQSPYGNTGIANLITSSSPPALQLPLPSSSDVSNAAGPSRPLIPVSPISVASTSPNGEGRDPFSRISHSVNPHPPVNTFATAQWRPKEPPCFFGRSTEDVHTWTSLVRHYLTFMAGSDAQQVAYTVTLLREAVHEWYTGYEKKNRGQPRDWAQLSTALLERFGSNIRSQQAQSQLMSISQGQRAVWEYASQFETLLGRLDSYDDGLMLNQFIWGLQPELARSVSLHYPKSIAQAILLAETTELAVKPSRRPGWKSSITGGNQARAQGQSNRGRGQGGVRGRGGNARGGRGNPWFPGRGRGRNTGGRMGQRSGGRSNASADPLACYVCGVRGHLACDCP